MKIKTITLSPSPQEKGLEMRSRRNFIKIAGTLAGGGLMLSGLTNEGFANIFSSPSVPLYAHCWVYAKPLSS